MTTHRIFADGDLVVTHNTYENADLFGGPTLVGFDVYRIEDGPTFPRTVPYRAVQ